MRERAYAYLEARAAPQAARRNEGWWPSYTAWQAFAVKVLVEGGRNQDSNLTRLYGYRDRMPVFALAYLHDALVSRRATPRVAAASPICGAAWPTRSCPRRAARTSRSSSDPYLLWFWNSNVRSTAIVLNSLVKAGGTDAPMRQMVRWLMAVRKDGRWGNTQENALRDGGARRLLPEVRERTCPTSARS